MLEVVTPCPKFGIIESHTYHRVCSCCRHATKKFNHHSKTISKRTVYLELLHNSLCLAKIKNLTWQVNVRSLNRVPELIYDLRFTYVV